MITCYFFTDPVDVYSWTMDADFLVLYLKYRHRIQFKYIMGAILDEWAKENKLELERAGDIYRAWREASDYSGMPVSGSLWLRDPINSSYPSGKVFNVVESIYPQLAYLVLRRMQEAAFVFDQNISRESILEEILNEFPIDAKRVIDLASSVRGNEYFQSDLETLRKESIQSIPSLLFVEGNKKVLLEGTSTISDMEEVLKQFDNVEPKPIPELKDVLRMVKRLYVKNISLLYHISEEEVLRFVKEQKNLAAEWVEFYDGFYLLYNGN